MEKSLPIAYACLVFGGIFGLHHFYLGRDRHGFAYFCTLGGFLLGVLYDIYKLPQLVKETNQDPLYIRHLQKLQFQLKAPAFFGKRVLSCVTVGSFLTFLAVNSIPLEKDGSNYATYITIQLIAPALAALVVHFIGTDGPMDCSVLWPLLGSYIGLVVRYVKTSGNMDNYQYCLYPILATLFLNWNIGWDKTYIESKLKAKLEPRLFKRLLKFVLLASLFLMLVSLFAWNNIKVTDENGQRLTLNESVMKYLNSEKFKPLKESLVALWNFYQAHGFSKLMDHLLYEGGDKYAIANAYKVIELDETASQKQLDQRCRQLSRKWHPDRYVKNPAEQEEAQIKFMEIQAACNKLSEERKNKTKKNKKEF